MLKELFKNIQIGKKDFTTDELKIIQEYEKKDILFKVENRYEINSKYKIATVKMGKDLAILEDLVSELKNVKIDFSFLNGAFDGDLVLAKRVFNPRVKNKAKIIKVLQGRAKNILVYIKDEKFVLLKEGIVLESKKAKNYKENDVLLVDNQNFELIKNIGNLEDAKTDEFISLFLYGEDYRLEEKLEVKAKMDDENSRVDLTHLPFCTIDPNSAKDHDDAIYYDKNEEALYVAIADVSYFVKQGSQFDKSAFKKATSIYLPQKVLPMLPKELSEELCSLKEGVNRYAYVFKIYLDIKSFQVKKSKLFEAVINSHKKYSYGRIDRVIEGHFDQTDSVDKQVFDYLLPLYELTKKFREKRMLNGYEFRTQEYRLKLKNSELEAVEMENSTPSHQLIEECMLLANVEASKKVNSVGIYRIHEEPPFKAISNLIDDVQSLGLKVKLKSDVHQTIAHIQKQAKYSGLEKEIDELIIKAQTQAKYSSKNLGHFGLGFKSYSHFTSPIRRYSDLVLHRMLKSKQTPKDIDDICEYISETSRKVDELVWDFEDRKYARWASKHIGEELRVKIVDTDRGICKTYDKIVGVRIVLDNYKGQKLFSKTKVIIKSSDLASKIIIGSIK